MSGGAGQPHHELAAFLGTLLGAALVIPAWRLPQKGINGWTGEPREKYYALRGWKWPLVGQ